MREEHRIGHTVHVRELSTRDEPGLRAMFRRLSKATIYERFHTPYSRVPEAMLAHLMGYGDGRSLVAVAGGEIVSHALYAGEPGGEAEIVVVVEDGWQSRGVGKLLLAALARKAAGAWSPIPAQSSVRTGASSASWTPSSTGPATR
jgi:GNAT superfamily N-acetyltransferase